MSQLIPGNQKHLTLDDRHYIADALGEGKTFKEIAKFLCKDPTTISKEIKNRRMKDKYHKGSFQNPQNFCTKRYHCKRKNVCEKIILCDSNCRSCYKCNHTCSGFIRETCNRLNKAPYVCNGCEKPLHRCSISVKYVYNPDFAQRIYRETLSSARDGLNMTRQQLHTMDKVITPLVAQGHSPYHIVTNHPELGRCVRSIYKYIDDGLFSARNIDLKRKPKFKPRKYHRKPILDCSIFENRTYKDFQLLEAKNVVEMDTVHSSQKSRKTLLTFYFKAEKLFLAFLLNRCTKGEVHRVFERLESRLGTNHFASLFPCILTDRGGEFADPATLETSPTGIQRTSIYYCDPMRSNQKGGVENVHTLLRSILPKGTSFEYLTQWDINLIVNHINATPRASLDGNTPYQLALESFGQDKLDALQLKPIEPDVVNLTPKLIK